jgi:protein TonB
MELPFRLHLPDRRRVASFTLALAVEALLIILLLIFGPRVTPVPKVKPPATFTLIPPDDSASTEPDRAKKADNSPKPKSASAPPSTLPPDVAPPQKAPPPPVPLPGVLPIQLGGLDISKIKGSGHGDDAGDGEDSKLAYGPGLGPGGMPLYRAEWYREPSNAELNGYVKALPPGGGWALIACKTVANYHVENCQSMGESPLGSGLGRDMRLAAWQFLVRPPRRGGKPLIGSWVSIRIDFHVTVAKRPAGPRLPFADGPKEEPEDPADGGQQ